MVETLIFGETPVRRFGVCGHIVLIDGDFVLFLFLPCGVYDSVCNADGGRHFAVTIKIGGIVCKIGQFGRKYDENFIRIIPVG
jgi:hypothetical protein